MRKVKIMGCGLGVALCCMGGLVALAGGSGPVRDDPAVAFASPPDSAKPWVNMWWIGKVTPADITRHLEELKDKGVEGALLIDTRGMEEAPFMSDAWRALFRHLVKEADRLGFKIASNMCVYWPTGGPWITLENSSWNVVSAELIVQGPGRFSGKLPKPGGLGKAYRDLAVQAFPVEAAQRLAHQWPVLTASVNTQQVGLVRDGNSSTSWRAGSGDHQWIQMDFGSPHVVDWAWVDAGGIRLERSDDGVTFVEVSKHVGFGAVPASTSRWYRLVVPAKAQIGDCAIGTRAEVERFAGMAAKRMRNTPVSVLQGVEAQVAISRKSLDPLPGEVPLVSGKRVDLTAKCDADGTLSWEVPAGTWKIVRIGQTTTGLPAGGGLLPDYLGPAATDQQYEHCLKRIMDDAEPYLGKTFKFFREDNLEVLGMFSWSPVVLEEFRTRRGYDPVPYLAALNGDIVDSVEVTDRFLADVRRTVADCFADNHYGRTTRQLNARGVQFKAEAGGQYLPKMFCCDGLMNQGRVDMPEAEFWEGRMWRESLFHKTDGRAIARSNYEELGQNVNAKQASSAAHLYGKRIVASEAFTSLSTHSHWGVSPADLMPHANIVFCEGINSLSIHGSATVNPDYGMPGNAFFAGTHFNHNVTWWNLAAKPFLACLSRCQYLLRRGLYVADVLYYYGDEAPCHVAPKHQDPDRGEGYDYDVCNSEIILTRLAVKDGLIVLPDGMSYRMLVLPEHPVMPLPVAEKIEALVKAGATVVGARPLRTPGLAGYPDADRKLAEVTERLWGRGECGAGRILEKSTVKSVLEKDGIVPDFQWVAEGQPDAQLDYVHRREAGLDYYFIANRRNLPARARCSFRVAGRAPELWHPVSGKIHAIGDMKANDRGQTEATLEFAGNEAYFVVFKQAPTPGSPGLKTRPVEVALELAGSWSVTFDPKWMGAVKPVGTRGSAAGTVAQPVTFEKLADWTSRPEPGIKYYSGSAIYRKTFEWKGSAGGEPFLYLDLGKVADVARVKLNGKELGVLWCAPWTVDVGAAIRTGANDLEIEVVNRWANRMIGDKDLPPEQRLTKSNIDQYYTKGGTLYPSGLLGPVRLLGGVK